MLVGLNACLAMISLRFYSLQGRFMKKFLLLLLSFLITSSSFALTNSISAESEFWSPVVQIKSDAPDSTGESIPGYCNATFIGKNVVVTAAHCLLLAYASKQNQLHFETGYYKFVTKPDGQRVKIGYALKNKFQRNVNIEFPRSLVDKVARSGSKTKIGPGEDFAIAWWNDETPETADMKYATVVTPAEHAQVVRSLSSHPLKVVTINFLSVSSLDTKRMGDLNNARWNGNHVHSKSLVRVEEGDSGAPVYVTINNQMKIFAVVKGRASTVFDNWDVYPSVSPHLCDLSLKLPSHLKVSACL